jgi:hypothetical protein
MPTIIDGSGSATFQTPLPLAQGGTGNTSGNVVSSQVAGAFNATGSAPLFACRAWVNFNGTGTVAIRASGNVSSITDNSTGDYTVNFATAMVDIDYAPVATCTHAVNISANGVVSFRVNPIGTTSSVSFFTAYNSGVVFDPPCVSVSIFR